MSEQIIITTLSPHELVEVFRPMFKEILQELQSEKEEFLSPAQTCKIFVPPLSKTTLAAWTKQGRITEHRIGGRVFYKLSEILEKSKTLLRYK